ncbi:sugar/nucleoside kinase (ribokinase family) [Pedobacter cryoconitis]|uniref:Sugar/nucleoside kinase (Ribokinase family) n=1 Tax=Pedobacter cryoconitis TaxID=188932 RepID=A0A7W8ZIW5_9SPHI|nr:PfkB family carbohydrate kinase [Pedobacter cryoconitis]MBB5634827.1 sugar/nucleoside kinase (ribokinase family) [Pedobacter cryoconitis]MBB6272041.1 sugar/nucleoside kinase (ribokinase family) [Pedobacter cryoconitis]
MYEVCCIGHITLDRVVTPTTEKHMAGGTSFYFSNAIRKMDVNYGLVTAVGESEMPFVLELRANGTDVNVFPSAKTVYFENIYSGNLDHRTQRVLQEADPFTVEQLSNIQAEIFHLGPLLSNDISVELIKDLAGRSKVSLDVQGYLREVRGESVCAVDWPEKMEALQYVHTVKADEAELEVLTGVKGIPEGVKILSEWGVREIVITRASLGSVIYMDEVFYDIPAFRPAAEVDATGCGDTYMAGYLYQRVKGAGIQQAGEFGAAMASLKMESYGPFDGTENDILQLLVADKR